MARLIPLPARTLALGAALVPMIGMAQDFSNQPFFDHTVELSRAFGAEVIGLRLLVAGQFTAPLDHELVEQMEKIAARDYPRFKASLTAADPGLAADLEAALEDVEDAVEAGKDATTALARARDLLATAYDKVVDPALRSTPPFRGALAVVLLLADDGVAEAYEDAVGEGERWEYPAGWAALQRVKGLWGEIRPLGSGQRQGDGDEMIAALDTLFPAAQPPASLAGLNPEEAETPSQRLGGIIEEVTNSNLYPGRDQARLAGHLATVADGGCAAYSDGLDGAGDEVMYAVFDLFSRDLSDTGAMFAPEAQEEVAESFLQLIGMSAGEAENDEDEADDDGDGDSTQAAAELTSAERAAMCGKIRDGLSELQEALGG